MQDLRTVNDAFVRVSGRGDAVVWHWLDAGTWRPIRSAEVYGRVRALARTLASWGVGKGDRIALLSENRWEWPVTDFAALSLGVIDVPLFPTLPADQVGYMLRDCGAKVAFVSTKAQYEKIRAAGDLPALERVVVMDQGSFEGAESFAALVAEASSLEAPDADFDAQRASIQPDDIATIIYTSGTTGEPKGVMLTHGNLASNFSVSTKPFTFSSEDLCISFLPLSHVTARHLDYAMMCDSVQLAYCPKLENLVPAMKQMRPTVFVAVPRFYEKIRQNVEGKSTGAKKHILNLALKIGKHNRAKTLAGIVPGGPFAGLAHKLVFSKIREAFGGRARIFVAGGAPLGMDTAGWFADAGIRIFEGYGLSETSPVIALNNPAKHRIGTVGPIIEGVQVRFAADGEIEVKGPNVFPGYWNKPEETKKAFTEDGWFCTGDIGKLDQGFLSITDRKKELLKTSGGKFVAPQPIENKLKANLLVSNAALVGDKRKFVSVLISPNFAALETWAKEQGLATDDHKALVKDAKVVAEYRKIVKQVNGSLADFESIKKIAVVPDEWSAETDELTPSLKLKRRVVEKKYASEIADFYNNEAAR